MLKTIGHIASLAQVGFVLAREGALRLVDTASLSPLARVAVKTARLIERDGSETSHLAAALTRLGPSYVKLGQFLATRPDVVGMKVARDLETLQDRMASFPAETARAILAASFDETPAALFGEIGPAMAAASVAQVHRVRLPADGAHGGAVRAVADEVAVKVLRPGVRERFRRDLDAMRFAAGLIARFDPNAQRLRPVEVVETLARSVVMEMDLRLEAAALSEFGENTRDDADFRVPRVDWERTARDVLTSEWIDGIPLSDLAALEAAGLDRVALGRSVIQNFLRHAMRDGFFHADMHQGNLFADASGRLVAVDCGIMGRIGFRERRFLAEILYGFIKRDYRRVAEVHFEAGYVPAHHDVDDFAQAIRAIGEPIHSRSADQISMAKLLTLLFEITALFDMRTRTELVMLQKTMVVVEGVGRSLDPQLDMWATAEPVVREWIERNLGPVGILQSAGRGASQTGRFLTNIPSLLTRGQVIIERLEAQTRDGFMLAPETLTQLAKAEAKSGMLAWAVVALAAAIALSVFW